MTTIEEFTDEEYVAYLHDVAADLDAAGTHTLAEDYREAAKRIERPVIPATTIVVTGPGASIGSGNTLKQAFDRAKENTDARPTKPNRFYGRLVYANPNFAPVDLGEISEL